MRLLLLVEAPGLLSEPAEIAEVEGAAGPGNRNLLTTAPANDLDLLVLFVVDGPIEVAIPANACEFFERAFVVEGG